MQGQWRLFSLLQGDFISARDEQAMMYRAWEVILEHAGVNGATLYLYKEGTRA
jgi:hypothetical protein